MTCMEHFCVPIVVKIDIATRAEQIMEKKSDCSLELKSELETGHICNPFVSTFQEYLSAGALLARMLAKNKF